MLTSSGARFGVSATLPHLFGVVIGTGIIGAVCGLGVATLILSVPSIRFGLQFISFAWIMWMAYRMLFPKTALNNQTAERPMAFAEAILFQWVNPKIWAVGLAAMSGHSLGLAPSQEAVRLGLSLSSVNFFVAIFWTFSGALLSSLLNNQTRWFYFRTVMALLLAASAALVFL